MNLRSWFTVYALAQLLCWLRCSKKNRIVTSCSWSHKAQASPECTLSTIDSVKILQKHFLKSNLRWIPTVLRNCLALCKHDVFALINGDNMIVKLLVVYSTYYNVEIWQRLPTRLLIYYSSVRYQVHFTRNKKYWNFPDKIDKYILLQEYFFCISYSWITETLCSLGNNG